MTQVVEKLTKVEHDPSCPDGLEWAVLDSDGDPVWFTASESDADEAIVTLSEDLGGTPNQGTPPDKRLKKNKKKPVTPDKKSMPPDKMPPGMMSSKEVDALPSDTPVETLATAPPQWRGVLVVEGSPTGDGREFAADSLQWLDAPMPLRWQKVDSHGGQATNETVSVGLINRVWRDGGNIMGEGVFDLGGPASDDAHEAFRRMGAGTLSGISIDADDITDADIEYVFPDADGETEEDDILFLMFASPEKMVFHSARIRAATLCDIPAFVEARIGLVSDDENQAALTAGALVADPVGAVFAHTTFTSDASWDGPSNEARLNDIMPMSSARNVYAWIDDSQCTDDGGCPKTAGKFPHHEVNADGTPGAANLTACSSGIGVLNGGRGGTSIPDADRRGVYDHLAGHLRDAGQVPMQFLSALVAHASWQEDLDSFHPPRTWFEDPKLGQYTPILVSDAGRVYGHAGEWAQCHIGFMGECVMPPFEDYHSYYLTGELPYTCDDGTRPAVGQITAGIDHAPMNMRAAQAKEHYENTDSVVCDVVSGNDKHGIWVAGAIRPWAQASRVSALRASGQVSPDWRRIGGQLRMVAMLTVNTSGYQVPRARSFVASGQIQALVSSGLLSVRAPSGPTEADLDKRAIKMLLAQMDARVHPET